MQKVDKMFAAFTGQPLDMVQQWTERDRFMSSSEVLTSLAYIEQSTISNLSFELLHVFRHLQAMDFGLLDALLETRY